MIRLNQLAVIRLNRLLRDLGPKVRRGLWVLQFPDVDGIAEFLRCAP